MPSRATVVYPVRARYLTGVPAVETEVATKAEAEELVASGAFSFERQAEPQPAAEPEPAQAGINPEAAEPEEPNR